MPQVQKGQTASGIAAAAGMTPAQFLALNPDFAAKGNAGDYQGLSGLIQPGQNYNLTTPTPTPNPVPTGTDISPTPVQAPAATANPNNPVISGSSVDAANNALGNDIKTLTSTSESNSQLLQDRMTELEKRRDQEIAAIKASYEEANRIQEERQGRDYAGRATGLITSGGGFLGNTQSQKGVLQNLQTTFTNEKNALMAKRDSAIQEAQSAYDDKQFALAQAKVAEAKSLEKEIYSRQKDNADQQLALSREARAQQEFELGLNEKKAEAYSLMTDEDFAKLTAEDIAATDKGYFAGYTVAKRNADKLAAEGKSIENDLKFANSLQTLINKTPAGQKITIGGKTYVGMKKAGTGSTKGLISPALAYQLKIPSLAGKDESDVILSLAFKNAPQWYKEFYQQQNPEAYKNISSDQLNADWELFKAQPDIQGYANSSVVTNRINNANNDPFANIDIQSAVDEALSE